MDNLHLSVHLLFPLFGCCEHTWTSARVQVSFLLSTHLEALLGQVVALCGLFGGQARLFAGEAEKSGSNPGGCLTG